MRGILILLCVLLWISSAEAATYYIDYTGGSDANSGTDTAHPWKYLKCMVGVGGVASAHTPIAGDVFVLKGGVTWPNAAFPCKWIWSGTAGNRITVTVDATWYTGGSWSRPIWDAEGIAIVGAQNSFLWFNLTAYHDITFSNIEVKGFYWSGAYTYGKCAQIQGTPATNLTLDQFYIHGWAHGSSAVGTRSDTCNILLGDSNLPNMLGSVLQNSIIDGSDSTGGGDSGRDYLWPSYINNVLHDLPNPMTVKGNSTIAGNQVYNCNPTWDGNDHTNVFESLGALAAHTLYFYNNIFHDYAEGCESAFFAGQNATVYAWNNLWYNHLGSSGNPPEFDSQAPAPPNVYFWNNTIVALPGGYCARKGHTGGTPAVIKIQNNHCITTLGTAWDPAITATSLTIDHNILQTPTEATAGGYTAAQSPYTYYPTAGNSATVGVGINLTASCVTIALCIDTAYGATIGANHTVVVGARSPFSRSGTAAWDVGLYQFANSSPIPVAPSGVHVGGTTTASTVTLIWTPNTETDLAGYNIYRSMVSGVYGARLRARSLVASAAAHSPSTRFIDLVATAGTYYYSITAYNNDGTEGAKSSEITVVLTGLSRSARQ